MKYLAYIIVFISCSSLFAQDYPPMSKGSQKLIQPDENRMDWSFCGVENGIPNYSHVIDVTKEGINSTGETNNSRKLQELIDTSTYGTVIYFPSGTYIFDRTIYLKSGIVIRGASSHRTLLKFNLKETAKPSFWFSLWDTGSTSPILSGYKKGSCIITVQDALIFKDREYIEIFQDNDAELMFTKSEWNTPWAEESVGQMAKIMSIKGNEISLEHPLHYDFSSKLNIKGRSCEMISGSGIENLKLERKDKGESFNIIFNYAANCWVRNVESTKVQRGHVQLSKSLGVEIRDSYFHHAYNYGKGGHGYGVNISDHSTTCLIENNIFYHLRHSVLLKEGAIGNVVGYNYSLEPYGSENDIAMHGHYGLLNLIEGNIVQKIFVGDFWGPSGPGNTFFRNRIETDNIEIQDYSHAQNIVANELIQGTIHVSEDTKYTWSNSNINKQGLIKTKLDINIPNSLYLPAKPTFYQSLPWPSIGPEFNLGQHNIPAKIRWESQKPVPDFNLD